MFRLVGLAVAAALAVGAAATALAFSARDGGERAPKPAVAQPLPAPVAPAFTVPTPRPLQERSGVSRWAPVLRPVVARAAPSPRSRRLARLATSTPEGTRNIVLVQRSRATRGAAVWVEVSLPVLPNGTRGWVPRSALGGYTSVVTRLVVDRKRLTATLTKSGQTVFEARVGVGRPKWPTPRGEFYVRDRLTDFRSPLYGPVAFGTSARSPTLTDWPAGGYVGIHGTNEPDLIPGRISHGCIRLRNEDILRLSRLMPVGTPVTIR